MATAVQDPNAVSVWNDGRADADPLAWRWHGPALGIALAMALATAIVSMSDGLAVRDTDKMLSGRIAAAARHARVLHRHRPDPARDQARRPVPHDAARRRPRALEPPPRRRGLPRAALVLRHLPVLPEPQGLPALPDRPGLRPEAAVARPQHLPRARPRPAAARPAGHRHRRPPAVVGLPLLPRVRADLARRRADRVVEPDPRALVRHRARPQLDAGRRLLPGAPGARPRLRRARLLRQPARDRHRGAAAGADLRAPRGAGRTGGPEHRGLCVAARLRRLHRGADRAAPAPQPLSAHRAVDVPRPDHRRDALLRLALPGRRHRRLRHRRDRGRARGRGHRPPAARRSPSAGARPSPTRSRSGGSRSSPRSSCCCSTTAACR